MITQAVLLITTLKLFFIPLYRSTDFEVHRNWLAITHNRTTNKWYYENISEWTLDYPPLFAWLEYVLSLLAKYFDPKMLEVDNLNYDSDMTVLFQRLSVITLDFVYIASIKQCSNLVGNGKLLVFILLTSNPGLLMVDHIHFQYNGFLYGVLMIAVSSAIRSNYIQAALWFAVLLNLKHIYIYMAPAFTVYLFRAYCFTVVSKNGVHTAWYSFSFINLSKLAVTVIFVFSASFGPFINHLPQIYARLFPFKRGLCHAYWAPNFWALYNVADKLLHRTRKKHLLHSLLFYVFMPKLGVSVVKSEASMTGGLVQEYDHSVLPSITPGITFLMTCITMLPALYKLWNLCADKKYRSVNFVRCIVICSTCAFMFGWHVHEKAILMILIPLSFLSVLGDVDGKLFLIISTVGHYSLFPLLYPKDLFGIKLLLLLTHCAIAFSNIPALYEKYPKSVKKRRSMGSLPMLSVFESLYVYGLLPLCIYEHGFHTSLGLNKTLPFLPLLLTSVYCTIGVLYFWISYYYYFMTFNLSVPTVQPSPISTVESKKKI